MNDDFKGEVKLHVKEGNGKLYVKTGEDGFTKVYVSTEFGDLLMTPVLDVEWRAPQLFDK